MAAALGLGVTAWSPLGGGILSGKYTGKVVETARLNPASISARDHAIAAEVQAVADELGASPAQVAIAWVMSRSPAVHPMLGARRLSQLQDNLAAASLTLPPEASARLTAAASFELGFPGDFIASASDWVFGAARVES